ncbi:hypothetical protein BLNAU_6438 [Blattamonas nauphoetae]|uniref:Uncharacterized protein n=1 Tax=Blattamonas nauphoetae TaxID=2049346 RepID=A0ABQ9Y4M5_9EUKA|nr:hypothetical protein BLNAU_6438 [Blattamonas nauphoetae]
MSIRKPKYRSIEDISERFAKAKAKVKPMTALPKAKALSREFKSKNEDNKQRSNWINTQVQLSKDLQEAQSQSTKGMNDISKYFTIPERKRVFVSENFEMSSSTGEDIIENDAQEEQTDTFLTTPLAPQYKPQIPSSLKGMLGISTIPTVSSEKAAPESSQNPLASIWSELCESRKEMQEDYTDQYYSLMHHVEEMGDLFRKHLKPSNEIKKDFSHFRETLNTSYQTLKQEEAELESELKQSPVTSYSIPEAADYALLVHQHFSVFNTDAADSSVETSPLTNRTTSHPSNSRLSPSVSTVNPKQKRSSSSGRVPIASRKQSSPAPPSPPVTQRKTQQRPISAKRTPSRPTSAKRTSSQPAETERSPKGKSLGADTSRASLASVQSTQGRLQHLKDSLDLYKLSLVELRQVRPIFSFLIDSPEMPTPQNDDASETLTTKQTRPDPVLFQITNNELAERIVHTMRRPEMKGKPKGEVIKSVLWELEKELEQLRDSERPSYSKDKWKSRMEKEMRHYMEWHDSIVTLHVMITGLQSSLKTFELESIKEEKQKQKSAAALKKEQERREREEAEMKKEKERIDALLAVQREKYAAKLKVLEEERRRQEEEEKKREAKKRLEEEAERQRIKADLANYHEKQRQEQLELALRMAEEAEQQMAEQAEQSQYNKERIEYRRQLLDDKQTEEQLRQQALLRERQEQDERLERLRKRVRVEAPSDPQRLLQDIEANKVNPTDQATADLFAIHGYSDAELFHDPQFHLQFLLRKNKVIDSAYAREVMREIQPLREPRKDSLTTAQLAMKAAPDKQ